MMAARSGTPDEILYPIMDAGKSQRKLERKNDQMRKIWKTNPMKWMAAIVLAIVLAAGVPAVLPSVQMRTEAAQKDGLTKKSGKLYFYKDGKALTGKWKTVKGKTYYFGKNGAAVKGWKVLKKSGKYKLFWFSSKAVLDLNKTKSVPQGSVHAIAVRSDKLLKKWNITKETAKKDAVSTIFSHLSDSSEYKYARDKGNKSKYWSYRYAQQMLSQKMGSCYHYAAAFGFLVKRATGIPVKICRGTAKTFTKGVWQPHAWAEIKLGGKWLVYDPNAAAYSKLTGIKFDGLKLSSAGKWYKAVNKETIYM